MNKRPHRGNVRAPTLKPEASISNAAALAVDGDAPLAASHDVLQAAMVPLDTTAPAAKKLGKKKSADVAAADTAEAGVAAPAKAAKVPKIKFVKCTFSLPESEAELLGAMKKTHQANGLSLKKGQLLRAALLALADVGADRLAQLVAHLPVEPAAGKKKK